MFTHQQLLEALPRLIEAASPPMELVEFDQFAFESPASEEAIRGFRGTKNDFPACTLFWVKSLQAQDWEGRADDFLAYAEKAMCLPMSEAEFFRLVAGSSGRLRKPLPKFLSPRPGFLAAMKMYGKWNDIGAIAEYTDAFVAYYWCTTA